MIAVAAAAALLAVFGARLFRGAMNATGANGGAAGRDPQFAEPAETVTRPPELAGESGEAGLAEDPSLGWDLGEQTPVDKTAEELSREAAAGE